MSENSKFINYISKRNTVTGDGKIVEKCFSDLADFRREKKMILSLKEHEIEVPILVAETDDTLLYEHVDGILYSDLVENMSEIHANALADWLCKFNDVTGFLRVDNNLRNYIFRESDNSCVGIDFESLPKIGDISEDCGKIVAFTATYFPSFSDNKKRACAMLIRAFTDRKINGSLIEETFKNEISAMVYRRKLGSDFEENAMQFYTDVKDLLYMSDFDPEQSEKRIFAYSKAQLIEFLYEKEGIFPLAENIFTYKGINLRVTDLGLDEKFSIPVHRASLEMVGNGQIRQEFYMNFLINHMTMGG